MFIPVLPLLAIAIGLQGFVFNHLNYYNTADLVGWTSLFFAGGSVSQVLLGDVTCVNLRVEGRMLKPLFPSFPTKIRISSRIENTPLSSLFNSAPVTASGFGEPAVHGHSGLSHGGLKPTRQSPANVPIRGSAGRLSTSAISPPFSLPTTVVAARPDHARASEPSHSPQVTQEADHTLPLPTLLPVVVPSPGERFLSRPPTNAYSGLEATVPPTVIIVGAIPVDSPAPGDRTSWASRRAWVLLWVLPIAVHLEVGSGLYFARDAPPDSMLLPRSVVVNHCSPCTDDLDLDPQVLSAQGEVNRLLSAGLVPTINTLGTPSTPIPPSGIDDSLVALARSAQLLAELRAQDLRVDEAMKGVNGAMKELSEHVANMPRWDEESDAPVASALTERRWDGMRARTGVSPLAHERTSGLSVEGALPTPGASRMRAAAGVSRAGDDAADDLEDAGRMPFNPAATSSPVDPRRLRYPAIDEARRMIPPRPVPPTSPLAPGPLCSASHSRRVPVSVLFVPVISDPDPSAAGYVSFGTLAGIYPPRPHAPEPDASKLGSVLVVSTVPDSRFVLALESSSSTEF
ncbi:hypothetical protein FRC10_005484 [Ceratobasidium sp. 414]|nr:hypothetical protein FRC10_005484 [Ceratobasidium sp. 414]